MLIDLNQRDIQPLRVVTLDLSVAGFKSFNTPGRAFVPYFFVTGTTNKVQAPGGLVTVYVNEENSNNTNVALSCKHNRGYRGSYSRMYITWAAQPGVSVDLVFLRSKRTPWMTTSALEGSGGNATVIGGAVIPEAASFSVTNLGTFYPSDATAGAITATLPPAGTAFGSGQIVSIQKVDSGGNPVTVHGGILGDVVLNNQGDSVTFYYTGTSWVAFA